MIPSCELTLVFALSDILYGTFIAIYFDNDVNDTLTVNGCSMEDLLLTKTYLFQT